MTLLKYSKSLIISISIIVIITIVLILFGGEAPGFIIFYPISMPIDSLMIFVLTIVISIICGYSMGYVLGPLFVQVHKKFLGRKMIYGIETRPETEKFKGYFLKALWPALLSINFAITLSKYTIFQQLFTSIPVLEDDSESWEWATFIALLPLTTGISLTLFSPVLYLSDAGIIYHNKEKIKNLRDSTEVRNVGLWYNNILKGYAGISVIIAYFEFIQRSIEINISSPNIIVGYILTFILIFYPIIILMLIIPTIITLDITHAKRRNYILKKVEKYQIDKPMTVEII